MSQDVESGTRTSESSSMAEKPSGKLQPEKKGIQWPNIWIFRTRSRRAITATLSMLFIGGIIALIVVGVLGRFKPQKKDSYADCVALIDAGINLNNLDLSEEEAKKAWEEDSPLMSCLAMNANLGQPTRTYFELPNSTPGCAIWTTDSISVDATPEKWEAYGKLPHPLRCMSMSSELNLPTSTASYSGIPNPTPGCALWETDSISVDATPEEWEAYDKLPHSLKCVSMRSTGNVVQTTSFGSATATVGAPAITGGIWIIWWTYLVGFKMVGLRKRQHSSHHMVVTLDLMRNCDDLWPWWWIFFFECRMLSISIFVFSGVSWNSSIKEMHILVVRLCSSFFGRE